MPYSARAVALRRCRGITKSGRPCRAWACWDEPRQLCMAHAGRHHVGPMTPPIERLQHWDARLRTRPPNCTCIAYAWPHRPGGGLCCWPDPPKYRCTTPAGTKRWP